MALPRGLMTLVVVSTTASCMAARDGRLVSERCALLGDRLAAQSGPVMGVQGDFLRRGSGPTAVEKPVACVRDCGLGCDWVVGRRWLDRAQRPPFFVVGPGWGVASRTEDSSIRACTKA